MSILAIDFGGTHIKIGRVDRNSVHAQRKVPVDPDKTFREQLDALTPVLQDLRAKTDESSTRVRGIGLAFPGLVDRTSTSILSTNKDFGEAPDVDIEEWTEQQFELPVVLENDARCALIGERYVGAGTDTSNLLMVTLGTGFGSSVLIEDKLLTGTHQQAGVLGGHITIRKNGYDCTCGNRGCVETEIGEWNLPRIIRHHESFNESALADQNDLTYRTLINTVEDGDAVADDILQERIQYMARGIVNLIHAYDPEQIVVGGGVMNRSDVVLPVLREEIQEYAWTPWGSVQIKAAEYPDYAALFGLHAFFEYDIQTM